MPDVTRPLATIQHRRGTAAEWTAQNPILADGEPGFERDTGKSKLGDGVTHWNSLGYSGGGGGGGGANLATTRTATQVVVLSDTGADATLAAADTTNAGVMSAADKTKLNAVAAGATANSSDATLLARGNHTGTQTSSTISDFTEAVQDAVAAVLAAGTNVTLTYNDAANTLTVAASGSGGGGLDAEAVRDAIGVALIGAGLITVTVNDAADTITISTTATANDTDANLRNRANHTGSQVASTISDFTEASQDAIAGMLAAGTGISLSYNDAANTYTIANTSLGGGLAVDSSHPGLFTVTTGGGGGGGGGSALVPETYGAVGDGTANDTTAMQSWLAAVTAGNRHGELSPGKVYRITAPLTISTTAASQWHIDGHGSTIRQATNNTSVIAFTAENISMFSIRNLVIDYVNQQTSSGGVAAITFDNTTNTGFGWYGATFDTISFAGKVYRGFQALETGGHTNPVWSSVFRNIQSTYGTTGTMIRLRCSIGAPNNRFERCYQHRHACNEPTLDLSLQTSASIVNLETNEADIGGSDVVAGYCFGLTLDTVRSERGTNNSGDALYSFDHCSGVTVTNWNSQARPFANPGSIFKLVASSLSVGPGTITTYSPYADAGANLAVVTMDSASVLNNFEGVWKPAAVVKVSGGTVTTGDQSFYGATLSTITPASSGGSSVPQIRKQSIMALGHSLMAVIPAYNTSTGVDTHYGAAGGHSPSDFLTLANLAEGSPLDVLGSAATAGYTVAQIRDTHLPTILAAKPEYCIVWAPCGNDMLAGGEFAGSVLDIEKYIYDQLLAVGTTPIVATLPPAANFSAQEVIRYNAWITNYAQKKGFPCLDLYASMVDPATGTYRSGENLSGDSPANTHPGPLAAARMVPVLRELIKKISNRGSPITLPGSAPSVTGRATNPLLAGTLGTNLPTGWTGSSVTFNLAAATYPVLGNALTVTSTGSFGYVIPPLLTGVAGDEWDLAVRWTTTPAAGGGWGMVMYDQGGTIRHVWGHTTSPNPTQLSMSAPFHARGKFDTGVTSLVPWFFLVGSGSAMQIAQYGFVNASAQSVTLVV